MEIWDISFLEWEINEEKLRETLTTLGNGYFATRGSAEESFAGAHHYPGTYLAGGFNRLTSVVDGAVIEHEDLVNWPTWTYLSFRHQGEDEWLNLDALEILTYKETLNFKSGELIRKIHFKDNKGRESLLESCRIVSMENFHVGAMKWKLTAINWENEIVVRSGINGNVKNDGVKRYAGLSNSHLINIHLRWPTAEIFLLESETSQSQIRMSQAIRTQFFRNNSKFSPHTQNWQEANSGGHEASISLKRSETIEVEKVLTLFTSKDGAAGGPSYESQRLIRRLPGYQELYRKHASEWQRIWRMCDLELPELMRETRLLRLHIFHLIQTVSPNTIYLDAGVPARGLHGEAYRGHIFWDEIFILPFLNLRIPELSRSLLIYRYRRLDEARANARASGYEGAMFPWQSASNGEEQSQKLHLNPLSARWIEDTTSRQRHINGAILFNIWQYYHAAGDREFLSQYGVEMGLEICRFWMGLLKYNSQKERYEICGVVGPDEFHTAYPGSHRPGIDNNAYTNYLASWCLRSVIELFLTLSDDRQSELLRSLNMNREVLNQWLEVSRKIYLPMTEDGIILQFEGFDQLKDLDWDWYKQKYSNIQRLDRILEAEGKDINEFKINKQADVLMLFYLFSFEELVRGFDWLGYSFSEKTLIRNVDYHLSISTNGSNLSRIVHSWVLAKYDQEKAWKWFGLALETDVADLQGGTSSEGIHLGAMAGTVDLIQRCFSGIEIIDDVLWIRPRLPEELRSVTMLIHFRGHALELSVSNTNVQIKVKRSWFQPGRIGINNQIISYKQGDSFNVSIGSTFTGDQLQT